MVVTSLAAQLKQLEAPQTSLLVHRTKKASFLFTEKEAANFERDTIYELGLSGLEELKKLTPQFAAFEKTLFDLSSKSFERSIQTSDVNDKLSANIKEISILLSPYFLLKPAHKVIEWLINRYHAHQFNVDELLMLGLPYHETMTFARLLQLFPLSEDKGKWNWLAPVKKAGIPLSKTALLNRAATDTAFFKFVCDLPVEAIKVYGEKAGALNTLFSFYCTTIVGGLETAKEVTDLHVSLALPSIMSALSSRHVDFTSSAYIILARLATKTKLSDKLVSTLYNKLSKVKIDKLKHETALLFIVLSQSSECPLPRTAVSRLITSHHFLNSIVYWSSRGLITITLITNLLTTSLQVIVDSEIESSSKEDYKHFIENILILSFDDPEAIAVFKVLIKECDLSKDFDRIWYKATVNKLQVSCPQAFDTASSEALRISSEAPVIRQLLGLNSSRNSVFDSLIHPNPDIRLKAVKTISKSFKVDQVGWLCETVVARLEDDSPAVVKAALSCKPALSCADKDTLTTALQRILMKCWSCDTHKKNLRKAFCTLLEYMPDNTALLDLLIFPILCTENDFINIPEFQDLNESKLVKFIKEKMKTENDNKAILWCSLEEGILPKYSDESDSMMELCQIHPVFKFLSLLLLAKEPALFESSFLLEFLDLKMDCQNEIEDLEDGRSLKLCMQLCLKGRMPLEPALCYISKYILGTKLSKSISLKKTSYKIKLQDMASPAYQSVLSVLMIFIDGCEKKNKNTRKIFRKATETLFEKNSSVKEERMYFLLNCAVYMLDKNINISISCVKHLLNLFLTNKLEDESKEEPKNEPCLLTSMLSLSSPAIPLLATLLHSPHNSLRSDVLKIFISLVESFSPIPGYRAFVEQIISNSEELKLDPEQITVLCYTQLSPVKEIRSLLPSDVKSHMKNALSAMMTLVTHPQTPVYITAGILEILECVNSSDLLIQLLPVLNNYIGKDLVLDKPQSKVVKFILKKFDNTQIESFTKEDVWTAFDNILSDSSTTMEENENETTNPAAYLINLLPSLLFDNLPNPKKMKQERFLTSIISKTYECENVKVTDSVSNFFKKVTIEGEIIASFLIKWFSSISSPVKTTPGSSKQIRKSLSNIPSLEILETSEWKKGVFLLEQIQSKSKFSDCTILIPALFNVLKKCLLFEHQAPVEYSKQLILSVLLQCCQSVGLAPISPELIQVDLIVQCLRISQNPQTHHHALLTLTIIANILPDNVLHSIMEIFTFIGTSIARQDDAYSFQIISKLVETIIPILVKGREAEVVGVVRVFVAAMLDIPEHRRQVLLLKLINTLDPAQHLWLFLALVFESHVLKHSSSQNKETENDSNAKPKKLEVASQLCSEFDVPILLETSARLLKLATALPHDKDERSDVKVSKDVNEVFNVKSNTGKQLRHFKYTLLGFLSSLLSSDMFIHQIALMSDEETEELEDELRRVMELCLSYVRELNRHQEHVYSQQSNLPASKYWKVMINQAYDVLDKVVGVLPVTSFVSVVCSLLQDDSCSARKVVELVTWRLSQGRPAPPPLLHPLLEPITKLSLSDTVDPITRQTALIALKLLTRHLASIYMEDFAQVLERLTVVLCSESLPAWEVTGSLVLCLGELASSLGAYSISQLSKFMPALLKILQDCNYGEYFLLSCVTCLHKIIDTLSNFLSPYLEKIIYRICLLMASLQASEAQDKAAPIISRLKTIRSKLASSVEGRVLVPAISECYSKMLKREEVSAVGSLMALLSESFSSGAKATPELSTLLLRGLAFRSETKDQSLVDLVEPHVLSTFTTLVLKLSESAFRPLYHKIYDWAIRGSSDHHRAITFYRLSCGLAERLRGLFVLFAGLLVSNCAILLDKYNTSKEKTLPTSEEGSILLVESIFKTLTSVFTHDSHNFLTKERFDLLMQPLVDQLENELGSAEERAERNEKILTPCLASMAGATGDDSLWKQLNYQILLKMRHSNPQVRLAALESVHHIAKKLGEDFLPLLPETVPFLAELLEDSDESIEKQTHRAIASMEAVLGEPIQKYF